MPLLPLAISGPDGVVLGLMGLLALRGAWKGFVWQAIRTGGLVIALLLGARWNVGVGRFLAARFDFVPDAFADEAGWILVVVGVFVATTLVAHLLRSAGADAKLSGVDRFFGFLLGALLGLAVAAFGFTLWASTQSDDVVRETLDGSVTTTWMARTVTAVRPLFPEGVRERWTPVLKSLTR
ncbi:MAG TPA: CvpA family protein [Planctomycetota bacterium]|nr:CvpA family protein [Planctomycetota bacterium]